MVSEGTGNGKVSCMAAGLSRTDGGELCCVGFHTQPSFSLKSRSTINFASNDLDYKWGLCGRGKNVPAPPVTECFRWPITQLSDVVNAAT